MARFRREARAVAALSHPNIVSIHDIGADGPTPFMVMELIPGESLSNVIWREAPLPVDRAARIGHAVALALAFAHDAGIVHRDVKPANIVITTSGLVKVLDFGIARAIAWTPLTEGGSVQGTAEYVSPEQVSGLWLDGRSDIYSLGVVLHEMLAGAPPFRGDTAVAVAYRHLEEQPPPLRTLRPSVPPAFEALVMRCLAKERWSRYQSAAQLAADLRGLVPGSGEPDGPRRAPHGADPAAALLDTPRLPVEPHPSRVARSASRRGRGWRAVVAATVLLAAMAGGAFLLFRLGSPARATRVGPPPLHPPSALRAGAACDGFIKARVELRWLPSSSPLTDGYVVYRADSRTSPFKKIELLPGRLNASFVDRSLNTSATYRYLVRSTAGARQSAGAATALAETPFLCI